MIFRPAPRLRLSLESPCLAVSGTPWWLEASIRIPPCLLSRRIALETSCESRFGRAPLPNRRETMGVAKAIAPTIEGRVNRLMDVTAFCYRLLKSRHVFFCSHPRYGRSTETVVIGRTKRPGRGSCLPCRSLKQKCLLPPIEAIVLSMNTLIWLMELPIIRVAL